MTMLADTLPNHTDERSDPMNGRLTQPEETHKSPVPSAAPRIHLSYWNAWATGGAAAVALVAVASVAVFRKPAAPDVQQARIMGYEKAEAQPAAQRPVPISTADFALRQAAAAPKANATMQNGPLAGNRAAPAANPQAPMIARTASLTILVKDYAAARASLETILGRYGGYNANLSVDTPENGQRHFQALLRIPANHLDSTLTDLKRLGQTVNESQSGEEVTKQHADLVARLENSRETEQRMRAILEQRTGKLEDILEVEEEIARVRGEIESMQAEQKALEHRVTYAGVELQLVEEYKEAFNSSPMSTSGRLRNAFVEGMRNAAGTVLGLILFVEEFGPAILIWSAMLGLPLYLLWRRHRKAQAVV